MAMLEGQALGCVRDRRVLFEDLSFKLESGAIIQIEGANGAGKTTLLRVLCGLSLPQQGRVLWNGEDILDNRIDYHRRLLYLGHSPGIKDELTALENLSFYSALHGGSRDGERLYQALDQVGLYGFEDSPARSLSAGQKRRVALARLWLTEADVWILDEPLTAIDRSGIAGLESRLAEHASAGGSVMLTSHQPLAIDRPVVQRLALTGS